MKTTVLQGTGPKPIVRIGGMIGVFETGVEIPEVGTEADIAIVMRLHEKKSDGTFDTNNPRGYVVVPITDDMVLVEHEGFMSNFNSPTRVSASLTEQGGIITPARLRDALPIARAPEHREHGWAWIREDDLIRFQNKEVDSFPIVGVNDVKEFANKRA